MDLRNRHDVDLALQPDDLFRCDKRLIFPDADMTFIQRKMINEISNPDGSEGEIDFRETLAQRAATLKGVLLSGLERLILNMP